ncbi:MAG: bifunctional diaminohydroxyphosphoribosylaminopyrimidine deaminase/5-amino-6-(5-phosphoribosylamino)uracil reductase RibD [Campylobacteraceae bacterium]
MVINDEFYLKLAINEAWKYQGLTYPNPAVGCAIVSKNGELLSVEAHQKAGFAHAELNAVKSALAKLNSTLNFPNDANELYAFILKNHNNLLENSTFYVTLEPCSHQGKTPSCARLLASLHVGKVVIGCLDENSCASGGVEILKSANIEVKTGVLKDECKNLLEPFLLWQKGQFSFLKIAQRLDGSYDNGEITSQNTRTFMHDLRDKCDLIAIGGETVRADKPTLDARLVNGKAPDILIFTCKDNFDIKIPLFSVKNRKVLTSNNLNFPNEYKNIMVEGGANLLNSIKDKVDWFLIFHNSSFSSKGSKFLQTELNLELLYLGRIENEYFGWYKKVT